MKAPRRSWGGGRGRKEGAGREGGRKERPSKEEKSAGRKRRKEIGEREGI